MTARRVVVAVVAAAGIALGIVALARALTGAEKPDVPAIELESPPTPGTG
jgi:hypothetical protein